jgi:quercetin dioxygenase-like cupin family protein
MPARLQLPGGVEVEIHVRSEQTDGAFTLIRDRAPSGWELPPHRHLNESETIHVTSGRLWVSVEDERFELGAGETVHVPRGVTHAGGTLGDAPVERVVTFSPGGMEGFFEAAAGVADPLAAVDVAKSHGWRFA